MVMKNSLDKSELCILLVALNRYIIAEKCDEQSKEEQLYVKLFINLKQLFEEG